jgi:predicted MFS family arabinose efflux permease
MRAGLLGGFFASASAGSVLGVILGGVIASRFGWQAAFGVVGIPGLIIALLYLFVRDYQTVETRSAGRSGAAPTKRELLRSIFRSWTVRWICIGAAAELISMSALWSWLPSFLNRRIRPAFRQHWSCSLARSAAFFSASLLIARAFVKRAASSSPSRF